MGLKLKLKIGGASQKSQPQGVQDANQPPLASAGPSVQAQVPPTFPAGTPSAGGDAAVPQKRKFKIVRSSQNASRDPSGSAQAAKKQKPDSAGLQAPQSEPFHLPLAKSLSAAQPSAGLDSRPSSSKVKIKFKRREDVNALGGAPASAARQYPNSAPVRSAPQQPGRYGTPGIPPTSTQQWPMAQPAATRFPVNRALPKAAAMRFGAARQDYADTSGQWHLPPSDTPYMPSAAHEQYPQPLPSPFVSSFPAPREAAPPPRKTLVKLSFKKAPAARPAVPVAAYQRPRSPVRNAPPPVRPPGPSPHRINIKFKKRPDVKPPAPLPKLAQPAVKRPAPKKGAAQPKASRPAAPPPALNKQGSVKKKSAAAAPRPAAPAVARASQHTQNKRPAAKAAKARPARPAPMSRAAQMKAHAEGVAQRLAAAEEEEEMEEDDPDLRMPAVPTKTLRKLLNLLVKDDKKTNWFQTPVTESLAPGYFKFIKRPMDYSTIRAKLKEYRTFGQMQADVRLMFRNAVVFNAKETVIHNKALELRALADAKFAEARNEWLAEVMDSSLHPGNDSPRKSGGAVSTRRTTFVDDRGEYAAARPKGRPGRKPGSGGATKAALPRVHVTGSQRVMTTNARLTYMARAPPKLARWGALVNGCSAECGLQWVTERPKIAHAYQSNVIALETCARKLAFYGKGLSGSARRDVLTRAIKTILKRRKNGAAMVPAPAVVQRPPPRSTTPGPGQGPVAAPLGAAPAVGQYAQHAGVNPAGLAMNPAMNPAYAAQLSAQYAAHAANAANAAR